MRTILALCLLAGCATDGGDAPIGPSTLSAPTIYERLGDVPGAIAGLPGFTIEHVTDVTRCGGVAVRIVRAPGATVELTDAALVRVLERPYPTGLDFRQPTREVSLGTLKHWFDALQADGQTATRGYAEQLRTATGPAAAQAAARTVQTYRFMASALARGEIPPGFRGPEHADDKVAAFCDQMAAVAEPLLAKADETGRVCGERSSHLEPGWWTGVCR